ncbi:hypothetical protein ACLQ2S_17095 [Micromonospora sp. DT48]|uniref:hypothetical protein n=1 Tax=unclassified Micromonospora TaxID=2617518 RepID=UPI0012BC1275|nr:hypothetical protein [Micromonospora sp. CP22]MTK03457.1 hypothetical protein [Micromonospora sp. CP22]
MIQLVIEDGPSVDAARAATTLGRELTRKGVPLETSAAADPDGSKSGTAVAAGTLLLGGALSVPVMRAVAQVVMAAMRRGLAGRIKLQDGERSIEIENASRDTERALVEWLTRSER